MQPRGGRPGLSREEALSDGSQTPRGPLGNRNGGSVDRWIGSTALSLAAGAGFRHGAWRRFPIYVHECESFSGAGGHGCSCTCGRGQEQRSTSRALPIETDPLLPGRRFCSQSRSRRQCRGGVWKRFLPSGLAPSGLLQGRCGPRVAPLSSPNSRQGRDDGKSEQKTPRPIPRPGRGRGRRAAGRGAFLL